MDRTIGVPMQAGCAVVLVCLAAWAFSRTGQRTGLGLLYLGLALAGLGSAYHHWRHAVFAADDIGRFARSQPQPVHLRGVLVEEPTINRQPPEADLLSTTRTDATVATLRVTALDQVNSWMPASGLARLTVAGPWQEAHVGAAIEVFGRLVAPHPAANPGEPDYAAALLDQRIRAVVIVRKTPLAVQRLSGEGHLSLTGQLMTVRAWAARTLKNRLPPDVAGVAVALLLGDSSDMTSEDWERYIRTGVIHVLAISGQHLVILAAFFWWIFRLLAVRRRRIAWLVAGFLLLYAFMTGGRPPILRAAVMVCAACFGIYLRRPALSANTLALAWLVVSLVNPADLASAGCQLSFLAVAILCWGPWVGVPTPIDPLEQLAQQSLPPWRRALLRAGRAIRSTYLIMLVIWLAAAPLVAARYHLISSVGLMIGPPVMVITAVALISGFLLLAAAAVCPPLVTLFSGLTLCALRGCEWCVQLAQRLPGGHLYVGDLPAWWLWLFYIALFAVLTIPPLRSRWRWALVAAAAWLCIGLGSDLVPQRPADELRCTFLAVGRGGCTVLELPDGRTILYDTGAMAGPELTRRQVAPFLWHEGIRRIDEIWVSHADLDHFNGLPALLERFSVGQVTLTPSFADKRTPGVPATLAAFAAHGVPVRTVHARDRLHLGEVQVDVLHPPAHGPEGNENARSLVLLVQHAGHTLLLTGDLEGPGLTRVLALPAPRLDILMAPHHGSHVANTPALADWARPRLVIASQGPPVWPLAGPNPYEQRGIQYLGTWPDGAVTIRSRPGELSVETFQSRQHIVLDSAVAP